MFNRLCFALVTLFWLTMNGLLWRSEFGGAHELASPVPPGVVWQKILTAPDDSSLEILQQGKRLGRCRWSASVIEDTAPGAAERRPEGMVRQPTGYIIDVTDGSLHFAESGARPRFTLHAQFSTNHLWQEFGVRVVLRPASYELRTSALRQTLALKFEDAEDKYERTFAFDELRDPRTLLREWGGDELPFPAATAALALLGNSKFLPGTGNVSAGLEWQAHQDSLKVGQAQVRVYRLSARLLDRYPIVIFVSRVGEILRVELPDNLVLVNEGLNY